MNGSLRLLRAAGNAGFPTMIAAVLGLLPAPSVAQTPVVEGSGTAGIGIPAGSSVWFNYRWQIQPDGSIVVAFSDPRSDRSKPSESSRANSDSEGRAPTPLAYQFCHFRLVPIVEPLTVVQHKNSQGNVTHTWVDFGIKARIYGVAKRQQKTVVGRIAASAGEWAANLFSTASQDDPNAVIVDRYGPAYEFDDTQGKVSHAGGDSDKYPRLNAIAKEQFRPGTPTPAQFITNLEPTGDGEFPNRTYLKGKAGTVRVKLAGGPWVTAIHNMDLAIGDMVETLGNGKAELVLAGTAVIRVKPNSQFIIPANNANTKERVTFIQMLKGVLWARSKKEDDSMKVGTPNAMCGARGTEFTVELKKADRAAELESWCRCYEGAVQVTPTGRATVSRPGQRDDSYAPRLLRPEKDPVAAVGPQGFLDLGTKQYALTISIADPTSGKPAVGARVSANAPVTGAPVDSGTIGPDGKVVLRLRAGGYWLSASYDSPSGPMECKNVSCSVDAEKNNEVMLALKSISGPVASVAGKPLRVAIIVEDDLHHPIPTARLLVRRQGESVAQAVRQVTDRTGRATLELPPGKYDVAASADRYKPKGTVLDLTAGPKRETEIIILLQSTSELPPSSPGKSLRVGILVEDDLHHPIPNAQLLLRRQGESVAQSVRQVTDRAGRATLELPPGKYDIAASADRYKAKGALLDLTAGPKRETEIIILLQSTSDLPPSSPGKSLRVGILVEDDLRHPIPNAQLLLHRQGESVAQPVRQITDRAGRATLELPPGKYDVAASADRHKSKGTVLDLTAGPKRETEIVILLQSTSELPPSSPGKSLRVGILVEDDSGHPIGDAKVFARRQGTPATQAVHQVTDRAGRATLELPPGRYDVIATAQHYRNKEAVLDAAVGRDLQTKLVLKRQDVLPPQSAFSFAGEWDVYFYNSPSTASQPTHRERWRIDLSRSSSATASQKVGNQWAPYCQGPLSENGQVWNVRREVNGVVVFQLENLRLANGGTRFAGKWNGAVPHGFAFLGIRAGTGPEIPVADKPKPPTVPTHPQTPVAPKRITVELSEKNRQTTVAVSPKDYLSVKVATYAGTGYQVELASPARNQAILLSGPRSEPMQRPATTGKLIVGAGNWQVYEFQVAPTAQGSFRIAFRFMRPGQQRAEIEYAVTVQVSPVRR